MERKNMVLLTVIAVATLLVAVVGATFAYFTANVKIDNPANNTTQIKTKALASATMTLGDKIEVTDALPGWKGIKTLKVKGGGEAGAESTKATIKLTPTGSTLFPSHMKYTLYKVDSPDYSDITAEELCTSSQPSDPETDDHKHYDKMTCTLTSLEGKEVAGHNAQIIASDTPITEDITVDTSTDSMYYLYLEYVNDAGQDQNAEQGKTFSLDIGFEVNDAA